jgi:peptidoglycan/LPS O-acetylase OafA/YrhL
LKKLTYLEGLRGIAALVVVFHHLVLMFYPALNFGEETNSISKFIATSPFNIFYNGDFAVCLFFVLSGYVLSYKYILSNDPQVLVGYAIKRYFRLLPLIAASIIFSVIFIRLNLIQTSELNTITGSGDWLLDLFKADTSFIAVIKNIFYGVLFLGDNQYNSVLWSMKLEFIGSMLLFGFLLIGHKLKPKWILFSIAFILAFYLGYYYYIAFIFGYGLCYLDQNKKLNISSVPLKLILLVIAIMCCSFPAAWQYWDTSVYGFMHFMAIDLYTFYHVLGSGILLLLIIQHQPSINFLSSKPIMFLGKISFPMYLFHVLILVLVTNPLFRSLFPLIGYNFAFIVSVIFTLPIIAGVSYMANQLIDKPALKFANKIESWFLVRLFKK